MPAGWELALPYSKVPGPKSIPVLGIMHHFFPGGKYGNMNFRERYTKMNQEYGDLVRLKGFDGKEDICVSFNPDHFETIFRNDGATPRRNIFDTLRYYRTKINPEIYKDNIGVLIENGEKWKKLRSMVNPVLMQPRVSKQYVKSVEGIVDEFITRTLRLRDKNLETPANFLNELNRWALESITCIALDTRLGCLRDDLAPDSEPQRMLKAVHEFFALTHALEFKPHPWKTIKTPGFYRLMEVFQIINDLSLQKVEEAMERMKNEPVQDDREQSILQKLIKINRNVAVVVAMDLLLAGVDTTSYTTSILLYHLSKHQRAQDKLREELRGILPERHSKLKDNSFDRIPYLRACLKESTRITPVGVANLRTTQRDIVLSGYRIPKGTHMILCTQIASVSPSQHERPNEFIPERWLRQDKKGLETDMSSDVAGCPNAKTANPFSQLTFGFGVRSCIGQRISELEIHTLIAKLIRNHRVEWHHPDLMIESKTLETPASSLRYKIIELNN
ncbi:cytochrome P450 CYP12A2-like [Ctenocephalides felis]|uniref:cytochrome P450 CYP12A2-like n=1 Tax=Ctenocephalides felis TaxID=7515 RepID=UPI000E6E26BF|nr:cytochrome P450 CYP12A2-like [Ctenocephalides felis]